MKKLRFSQRPGFNTRAMRWVYRALYPYFHCKVRLTEELRESREPVVFIANHYNVFGPVSFILSMPVVAHAWINVELIQSEKAAEAFQPGLIKLLPFVRGKALDRLSGKVANLACRVLHRFGVIPVDRNHPSTLISTMRESIRSLEEGNNLVIFPETGLPEYSLTSVTPFFSGFATLGRLYYRKTGKTLMFCPCYIDEQHHQIRLGECVRWNPETEDPREETERVSDQLNLRIREMAAESRGVEKEESTPVRRTILFFCNLARLLLMIPLVTMLGLPNPAMILLFYGLIQGLRLIFNAVNSTYVSTNRMSVLFSHALDMLTDLGTLLYLNARDGGLRWLLLTLVLNAAVIFFSNIRAFIRYRRCAGMNYFDTLCSNLLCLICLAGLTSIALTRLVWRGMILAAIFFLGCSAGFAVVFNMRIGLEER
ncbi:MAG: hypothetical protein IKE24_04270 [Clostridia bacterium]|nr:hypothetical protein [Clostridia bacterium]